jgi:hypothetical protein
MKTIYFTYRIARNKSIYSDSCSSSEFDDVIKSNKICVLNIFSSSSLASKSAVRMNKILASLK